MGKTAIATRQIFFIVTPLIVIPGHFFLIKVFLDWAWKGYMVGDDPWICPWSATIFCHGHFKRKTVWENPC